jgi:hypothetical protein
MKRKIWCGALVLALLLASNLSRADDAYVIVGGRGVGTAITTVPRIITTPGFYYLNRNLTTANATDTAITINTSGVTLDLMGFSISAPSPSTGDGVHIAGGGNVEVRNGVVSNFANGIYSFWGAGGDNHRLINLRVSGCGTGIYGSGDGIIVLGCQALDCGTGFANAGAWGALYERNTAMYNGTGFDFIGLGNLVNNTAGGNGNGFILPGSPTVIVDRCNAHANMTNWTGLAGCTVTINTP